MKVSARERKKRSEQTKRQHRVLFLRVLQEKEKKLVRGKNSGKPSISGESKGICECVATGYCGLNVTNTPRLKPWRQPPPYGNGSRIKWTKSRAHYALFFFIYL